jgi:hypothetical protein
MSAAAALLVQMARDSGRAVVTEFDLFLLARQLFHDRGYRGASIPSRNGSLDARRTRKLLSDATFGLGYPAKYAEDFRRGNRGDRQAWKRPAPYGIYSSDSWLL